jgi:hypothetical protein
MDYSNSGGRARHMLVEVIWHLGKSKDKRGSRGQHNVTPRNRQRRQRLAFLRSPMGVRQICRCHSPQARASHGHAISIPKSTPCYGTASGYGPRRQIFWYCPTSCHIGDRVTVASRCPDPPAGSRRPTEESPSAFRKRPHLRSLPPDRTCFEKQAEVPHAETGA